MIKKNSGYFSTLQENPCSFGLNMVDVINTGCFMSDDEWKVKDVGYMYLSKSDLVVAYSGEESFNIVRVSFMAAVS